MKTLTLLGLVSLTILGDSANAQKVQLVQVKGSNLPIDLATKIGMDYDPALIQVDVRTLYATGRFHDVVAKVKDHAEGKLVTFHVVPDTARLLRQIHYRPTDLRLSVPMTSV